MPYSRLLCLSLYFFLSMKGNSQTTYSCPFCDLTGKDFQGQDLTNANFSFAKLDNANFSNCTLNGAMFDNASLHGANFNHAQINASKKGPANFSLADCSNAIFSEASMHGAILTYANLNGTRMDKADLTDARPGLKLLTRGPGKHEAPNFEGATLPCAFRRLAKQADFSKARVMSCEVTPAVVRKSRPLQRNKVDSMYVSTIGSDDNKCGTAGHPCKTLKEALSRAPLNCVIAVGYGEYTEKLLTFENGDRSIVGGLDDENQWQSTGYQSSISFQRNGLPGIFTERGFGAKTNVNLDISDMILNGNSVVGTFYSSSVLVVGGGTTVSLSNINMNAGQAGAGTSGSNGYDINVADGMTPPGYSPYVNCGAGGKANPDIIGNFIPTGII